MAGRKVMMLPGSVLPGSVAYAALVEALGDGVDVMVKELELYATDTPPVDYSLDHEIDGILRAADAGGWDRFDLVGYSGGGAACLAFAAKQPHRLTSLALLEPAWAGNWDDVSPAHKSLSAEYDKLAGLPPEEFMRGFMRLGIRSDVPLPPPQGGPVPPWMALRPAGIQAFMHTFKSCDLDRAALTRFDKPVLFVLGGLSNPDDYGEIAERLGRVFADYRIEVFAQRHHFDPPHRVEPERVAAALRSLWAHADELAH